MTKLTRRILGIFLGLSFVFAITASVIRIMALAFYEAEIGYYPLNFKPPIVLHYFLFATVLFFGVAGFYLRGKISLRREKRGVLFYSSNALLGTALAAYALFYIPHFFQEQLVFSSVEFFLLLSICLTLLGVFYCLQNCLSPEENTNKLLLLGLSLPLMCIMQILYEYFETSIPINNPNKLLDQFTLAFVALYMLFELRILFKQPRYAAQSSVGMIAFVFSFTASVPSIIYTFWHGAYLYRNAAHDVLMLGFALYIAVRLVRLLTSDNAEDDSTLARLLQEAERPTEALERREPLEEEIHEEQLTFDSLDTGTTEAEVVALPYNQDWLSFEDDTESEEEAADDAWSDPSAGASSDVPTDTE